MEYSVSQGYDATIRYIRYQKEYYVSYITVDEALALMYEGKLPAVNFATEGYWTIEQIEASTGRICPYAIIYHNDEPVTIIEVP